jgi:ABC-type multidrug transport system permease subunit
MTVTAAESVTIVVGGLLYFLLLVTLGIISIRKGHWVMFIIGIFIPLFWLIGALLPPTTARAS